LEFGKLRNWPTKKNWEDEINPSLSPDPTGPSNKKLPKINNPNEESAPVVKLVNSPIFPGY